MGLGSGLALGFSVGIVHNSILKKRDMRVWYLGHFGPRNANHEPFFTAFWLTFPPRGTFVDMLGTAPPPRRGKGGQVLSHVSEALAFPPEHTQLASTRQAEEQPSPPKRFPSSHSSPSCGVYFRESWYLVPHCHSNLLLPFKSPPLSASAQGNP